MEKPDCFLKLILMISRRQEVLSPLHTHSMGWVFWISTQLYLTHVQSLTALYILASSENCLVSIKEKTVKTSSHKDGTL